MNTFAIDYKEALNKILTTEPSEINHLKITKPDKDIIRLTEKILDQNKMILEMNSKLLLVLAGPVRMMEGEKNERESTSKRRKINKRIIR